jgi:hypothetical protein
MHWVPLALYAGVKQKTAPCADWIGGKVVRDILLVTFRIPVPVHCTTSHYTHLAMVACYGKLLMSSVTGMKNSC